MQKLNLQELHHLAMNVVGKELEDKKFEFIAINSKLKKHPQFVCVDANNNLHYILVKAVTYPNNPNEYDNIFLQTFKEHANKKKAKVWYAGVGIANASNFELPVYKDQDFILNYNGIKEIF